jgi:alkanesulfonate monooxygenase SsuD/methylene tetrahydromethanopterin reductase-like flavin-dependent oxidoreductase (luciferase family)
MERGALPMDDPGPSAPGPSARSPRRPLKVGLIVPGNEGELAGATPRWWNYIALARMAEEMGFDSLWVPDHLLWRADDGTTSGTWEGWSLLTALAAVTIRVDIGSFVTCTGFRAPALLAKMADTVDEISGGRLILGLGAGWNEPEYRAFGFPYEHRVGRFAEAVEIIHGLLRTGHVDVHGAYYAARDCELRPRGPRPGGPPIMIGTTGARMLRLVAQYADAWNVFFSETGSGNRVARIPALQTAVDAACNAEGRDPAAIERTAAVFVNTVPGVPLVLDRFAPPLRGTAEELAAVLRAYAASGIAHVQLWIEPATPAGIAAFGPVLERLDGG